MHPWLEAVRPSDRTKILIVVSAAVHGAPWLPPWLPPMVLLTAGLFLVIVAPLLMTVAEYFPKLFTAVLLLVPFASAADCTSKYDSLNREISCCVRQPVSILRPLGRLISLLELYSLLANLAGSRPLSAGLLVHQVAGRIICAGHE